MCAARLAQFEAGAAEFDALSTEGMELMEKKKYGDALKKFEFALTVDEKTEGRQEISLEKADVAYNMSCCYAQLGQIDVALEWLRRSGMWGVQGVNPLNDEDLEPLARIYGKEMLLEMVGMENNHDKEPAAVLGRSRRMNAGRYVMTLAQEMSENDDESDGGEFEASEEEEARDVFDSDFDESEDSDEDNDEYDENDRRVSSSLKKKQQIKDSTLHQERAQRSASRIARAVNAVAVQSAEFNQTGGGSDDEDGDFEDTKADAEMKAQQNSKVMDISTAAQAGARKRKVEAAYLDIFGKNDDGAASAALAEFAAESQVKRSRLSDQDIQYYNPKAKLLPTAFSVLSEIFGQVEAATMILRARNARRARAREPTPIIDVNAIAAKALEKKEIIETRHFAGEKIEISRSLHQQQETNEAKTSTKIKIPNTNTSLNFNDITKKSAQGRLDAVLKELRGPKTVTAVEKSAHDWDQYKAKSGLEESLRNVSKEGYLSKQDFLQRVDYRQFEHERDDRQRQRLAADADEKTKAANTTT
uniref:BCNT-C domain-containing protein n=1 Tax=Aureoumbra lagunensis TaxID=44058 RepID=A0A6S8FAG4_9STRA|mmetsp:Transcript_315/g.444  ORF Transcript_315/g.444 Transcript_315/m.444 type:complete len:531 (+) Transcript_315:88-1680(+)